MGFRSGARVYVLINGVRASRRQLFGIAWPIILSNLSTPLLGFVDTFVIGNLGDSALIGAIAVGAMIFSFLYWGFGFLRMGTTGLVAQATGAGEAELVKANLYRPLLVGFLIGCALLLLSPVIRDLAFRLLDASAEVERAAATYYDIRILAAPVSLAHLAIVGYLLGIQRTGSMLAVQLVLNTTNIVLDFVFVVGLHWGVAGVAAATVIAECLALSVGSALVIRHLKRNAGTLRLPVALLLDLPALKQTFLVNRDIMIRTLCLIFAFAWFTNQGARAGDVVLAANAVLMQFVTLSAFFLDGFALAAETTVGHAVGARDRDRLDLSIRHASELAFATSLIMSVSFLLSAPALIDLLTNVTEVRAAARQYLVWALLAPPVSVWCYVLDGVFIGATRTVAMRNAMLLSLAAFLAAWYVLQGAFGNHGLWAALMVYYLARAASLGYYLADLRASVSILPVASRTTDQSPSA